MTAENLENNENSPLEEIKPTTRAKAATKTSKDKEVVALSVKNKAEEAQGMKLIVESYRLPHNRPIEASHLNIVSTYSSAGGSRPVVSSGMEISETLTISGNRPIAASHLKISETYSVMGSRPVASNEIDDPEMLMGFLD